MTTHADWRCPESGQAMFCPAMGLMILTQLRDVARVRFDEHRDSKVLRGQRRACGCVWNSLATSTQRHQQGRRHHNPAN